jgi:hypothetical protein
MNEFPLFCGAMGRGVYSLCFWFRICGYGPHVSMRPKSLALFSERNGYRKALYLWKFRFEWLTPE